jgi:hypothetical protein
VCRAQEPMLPSPTRCFSYEIHVLKLANVGGLWVFARNLLHTRFARNQQTAYNKALEMTTAHIKTGLREIATKILNPQVL